MTNERELDNDELELMSLSKLEEIDMQIHAFNETCNFHGIDKVLIAFSMTNAELKKWMEDQNESEEPSNKEL